MNKRFDKKERKSNEGEMVKRSKKNEEETLMS